MSKLIIHNFGPLKDVEINTDKSIYMIGESASGKSTIAKLIFFFECISLESDKELNRHTIVNRQVFYSLFKGIYNINSKVEYIYDDNKSIFLSFVNNVIDFRMSANLMESINRFYVDSKGSEKKLIYYLGKPPLFIPSGRNTISILAEAISQIPWDSIDFSIKDFVRGIGAVRSMFDRPFEEVISFRKQFVMPDELFDEKLLHKINSIASKILNGEYRFEQGREVLYFADHQCVDLSHASSGQQESLWIILYILATLITGAKVPTLIIEEPEAHLHPRAQYYLMQIIQIFANIPGNKVIITTHSPYIISCLNNLLYANKVGRVKPDEVNQIIDKDCWADVNKIDAYQLENGGVVDIMHRELEMIKIEILDEISEYVNAEYNKILDLDE